MINQGVYQSGVRAADQNSGISGTRYWCIVSYVLFIHIHLIIIMHSTHSLYHPTLTYIIIILLLLPRLIPVLLVLSDCVDASSKPSVLLFLLRDKLELAHFNNPSMSMQPHTLPKHPQFLHIFFFLLKYSQLLICFLCGKLDLFLPLLSQSPDFSP